MKNPPPSSRCPQGLFYHGGGARIKRREKGEEKKGGFCVEVTFFFGSLPHENPRTTPDITDSIGSALGDCSSASGLSPEVAFLPWFLIII